MTIAKCTEDGNFQPEFDFYLYGDNDGNPSINFMLPDGCWPEEYDGFGVFTIDLKDLLEGEIIGDDDQKITSILRECAEKIDAKNNNQVLAIEKAIESYDLKQDEFKAIVQNIVHVNTSKRGGDIEKTIELVELAMRSYNVRPSPCVHFCEQNAYKSEINRLKMLCKEASDYLDANELTSIGHNSILHQKFKAVSFTIK